MPFWWKRRRRPWYGRWRRRRAFKKYKTRRQRRRFTWRRNRKAPRRRRRRRRRRVRRKRKYITVKQWQPDSVVNCKIKGTGCFILGAQGMQGQCYTNVKENYVPPKSPGGGGFAAEQFSLSYLYEEYIFHRNIWTKSNLLKDLCMYLKCKFTFYRHPDQDFIVAYERQPPFPLTKTSYTGMHPQQMLLLRKKRIILSKFSKPHGKIKTTMIVGPPKQMITKWFFTHHFCQYALLLLKGTVANLNYANLGCCNTSQQTNVYFLNRVFYKDCSWGLTGGTNPTYKPQPNLTDPVTFVDTKGEWQYTQPKNYNESVSYNKGWFQTRILNSKLQTTLTYTTSVARYNPATDDGKGNKIFLVSIVKTNPIPPSDPVLIYEGLPLWLMLWGYLNYVVQTKKDKTFLKTYYLVIICPSMHIYHQTTGSEMIIIDKSFVQGKNPYDEYITDTQKLMWYPTIEHQIETINQIIQTGPFVPKLDQTKNSTWELDYFYTFFFKWGGPEITDPAVTDPSHLQDYDVPDHLQQTVQITNPTKQIPSSYLHPWDSRRGFITQKALKRMREDIETDTDFLPDSEKTPKKRKRITAQMRDPQEKRQEVEAYLQTLYEENIYPQEEEGDFNQLIQQQREQQFQLKRSLLQLLVQMKEDQKALQLHTGLLQ
nr:MAG: ORF1 [Torque teno midi virus]